MKRSLLPWGVFSIFVVSAVSLEWHPQIFQLSGSLGFFKIAIWCAFLGFFGYSIYCSSKENIYKSIGSMMELHWGRQAVIDLYLGALIFISFILLHQGSLIVAALWLIPILLFANLATLLYLAIHFDSIIARFMG